ncbi:glycine zipper 2TM domain-containing protein [Aliiroseovarius sp. KMU-50]|uniref:17 kDa surface antigen n=1 Tax=Aliiroseovarius salicola TaxID=3009082 RepID=A0ABT4W2J4_9RHOB|nr:glycine zipper 2TM domain-containing protein [Aliiroseovarius sp. KMU-50]MDA5094195.1 glycine zipper 2TM domain-containing protein [Aliiroseovarius sp. KMU-50]
MYKPIIILTLAAGLGLTGCQRLPDDQQRVIATASGAVAGLALADLLGANKNWKVVGTLAGAAAGNLIARNAEKNQCAYSDGKGGYYTGAC